jgi:MSHA biogenesis protein MshL
MFKKKLLVVLVGSLVLNGCTTMDQNSFEKGKFENNIKKDISKSLSENNDKSILIDRNNNVATEAVVQPKVIVTIPDIKKKEERKFNFIVDNIPIQQVYMALVDGSSYSVVLPENMTGNVSLNLKKVTAYEVLEILRKRYGYDYEVDSKTIMIQSKESKTRIFTINHPVTIRNGSSELRVTSGSVSDSGGSSGTSTTTTTTPTSGASGGSGTVESSKVSTSTTYDFWAELERTVKTMVVSEKSSVAVSPLTNTLVVKGTDQELNLVEKYLKEIQAIVDRQVIVEAKIVEVQLSNGYQSGINWSNFNNGANSHSSIGYIGQNTTLGNVAGTALSASNLGSLAGQTLATTANGASLLGLAFQSSNFAALLSFLEKQGDINVLSSPRIATLNNQNAILKVGTDDFFVTNVTSTVTSSMSGTTSTPNVTVKPFFSGIALDITPQIGEDGMVSLHIHPSISDVQTVTKQIDLGGGNVLSLPLASSSINETDTVVKVADNNIVAIGGLMRRYVKKNKNGIPGLSAVPLLGEAFKNTDDQSLKYELVILLKPHVVHDKSDWDSDLDSVKARLANFDKTDDVLLLKIKNK